MATMQTYRAGRVKKQRNHIGAEGQQLNSAKVTLGEDRLRGTGREPARSAGLFSFTEARGPAVKRLARERDAGQVAWSQALFCEVLIKKTHNFSFFNLPTMKQK